MRPPVLPGMSLPGVFLSGVLLSGVLLSGMILSGAAQAADSAISSTLRASGLSAGPMALPDYAEGEALDIVPILRWSRRLPGRPPAASSRSEPAGMLVVGDRIYTGYSGSNSLLVLSRRDGTLIRYLPANGPVSSAPVLVGTDLYYTDAAGYTTCFDLQAEQTRWSRYSGAPVLASAVVEDGAVYVTNVDDQVYALDAMTGELRWRYAHRIDTDRASRLTLYSAPSVTLDGDQVVAGFSDGQVVGIGRADGAERWLVSIGEGAWPDITAGAVVAGNTLIVGGYSGPLVALDRQTRSLLWRLDVGTSSTPLVDGDWLYHGGTDGKLRRVNVRTGQESWSWQADIPGLSFLLGEGKDAERTTSGTLGSPRLTDQGLLVGNSDGSLYLVDPADGRQRWALDPGRLLSGFLAPPAVDGSEILAISNNGILYSLRGEGAGVLQ